MMLRYGLLTPLRDFGLPQAWTGSQHLHVEGARELALPVLPRSSEALASRVSSDARVFAIPDGTRGVVSITRNIAGAVASRLHLSVGADCDVTILETQQGTGVLAATVTVSIEPGARVTYALLQDLSETSIALLDYEASVAEAAHTWSSLLLGAATTQAHFITRAGRASTTLNHAAVLGTGEQQFDVHVATIHTGEGSTSSMLTRSVLDDASRGVYHGLIRIGPDAGHCDSYQKDEALLLSPGAAADAIPDLEIQNNTVRCTHGATIGKLDEEKLFYFRSRGIPLAEAKRTIAEGFLTPLLKAPWHEKIHAKISRSSRAA